MRRIIYSIFIVLAAALCGCSYETGNVSGAEGDALLTIGVVLPHTAPPKGQVTKSDQNPAETAITQVRVLVFENDAFSYTASGSSIKLNSLGASFTAKLKSTANPLKFYIVANSNDVVDLASLGLGDSYEQVREKLIATVPSVGITIGVGKRMWGLAELPAGIDATQPNEITNVPMLRAIARIDVLCREVKDNFRLSSIQAFRVADRIQIVPDNDNYTITSPSVPSGTQYTINSAPIEIGPDHDNTMAQLYLPEAEAQSDPLSATCIVIGGYYMGSQELSYYRIDIASGSGSTPEGEILRNTRYEFEVKYIVGDGYPTAQEAADNPSAAVDVQMVLWRDDIRYTVFDRDNYLGVSHIQVFLDGDQASSFDIGVETDFPEFTMRWTDRAQNSLGDPVTTTLSDTIEVTKVSSTKITVSTAAANPFMDRTITKYFLLEANNLKMFLTVLQFPATETEPEIPPGPGGIIWAPGNVDEPGTFAEIGELGKFYQWGKMIGWPGDGSVTDWDQTTESGVEWSVAKDPCPEGWRVPTNRELDILVKSSVGHRWIIENTPGYPTAGVWIADEQSSADNATFGNPGNAVYFPAGGKRNDTGSLVDKNSNCYYWASDMLWDNPSWFLGANGTYNVYNADSRKQAALIRCVKRN